MTAEVPVPNLETQLLLLQRKNAWLERQVILAEAGVPENYAGRRELGIRGIADLARLTPERQAELFWRVALGLSDAQKARTLEGAAECEVIHNLEWNGEEPHPTWKEVTVDFLRVSDKYKIERTHSSQHSSWTIITATRHDGTEDAFSMRNITLPHFRDDRTPVLPLKPDRDGWIDEGLLVQGADKRNVAELLDFTRGVRGGLQVLSRRYITRLPSSD